MYDNQKKEQFVELRAKGNSFTSIAETLGVSKTTLIEWSHALNEQVSNLRAIEEEHLIEKHKLTKERSLQLLASQLDKLEKTLETRDFSKLPDEKLIMSLVKVLAEIREFRKPVTFQIKETGFNVADMMNDVQWAG